MTRIALAAIVVSLVSGCGTAGKAADWIKGRNIEPTESVIIGAPGADTYLDELYQLAAGDPATQAEIFADADSAARLTPGPSTNLRLALVLSIPGHSESDAERAQSLLREVLAQTELMTQAEIALATIQLNSVERYVVASAEVRNLRESTSRAAQSREQAANQRLASVESENQRLRSELADAEQKLEAITSIERTIRDQE